MAVLTDIYGGLAPHGRDHAVLPGDAPWRLASRLSALLLRPTATEFDRAVADDLLKPRYRTMVLVDEDVERLLDRLNAPVI